MRRSLATFRGVPLPEGFLLGTANADHQVEAHDPACEDVWDVWERAQGLTPRGKATDFWNRYEEDVSNAAGLGLRLFRFSISWARVETSEGVFDAEALAHYRRVAECVKRHGMQVMVTLHHFVWPVWLERDHGGMTGERFPEFFTRYAGRVAEFLGDLVDWWITFNEPSQLTFGYIKPWWRTRYYMPPGLATGTLVEKEARAVGRLVPNLFLAHARARAAIRALHPAAKVGANPLVTGFPGWVQMAMDWGATHRGMAEALFKFTNASALVSEPSRADLVIAGVSAGTDTRHEESDPYVITRKALLVREAESAARPEDLIGRRIGALAVGNSVACWQRDLPTGLRRVVFRDYHQARVALREGRIDAVYGDALALMEDAAGLRLMAADFPEESYAVVAAYGHRGLIGKVNAAIAGLRGDIDGGEDGGRRPPLQVDDGRRAQQVDGGLRPPLQVAREAARPVSLREVFGEAEAGGERRPGRGLKRVLRRGKIRIGLRVDAPELERRLARLVALEIFGTEEALEVVALDPVRRLRVLDTKTRWLNWAWRFWGSVSLIGNANWWYLGMAGKLAEELCPAEAVGAQDFVGLDYYWGLPTWRLGRFRSLEDAALGKFTRAPVWPEGLLHALRRFHRWFPGKELFLVENGCVPQADGMTRGEYLQKHLAMAERAIAEGVPLAGFNVWSVTSNREWGHAFDPNTDFGLYFVDLDKDGELRRVPTAEVEWIRKIAAGIPR